MTSQICQQQQNLCDHAILLDRDNVDSRAFLNRILISGYGLYVFHRTHWKSVRREIDVSDGDLGNPESLPHEYWAIRHCGSSRHRYRLIPLSSVPDEWSSDRCWSVRSQKHDTTCRYDELTRLEADVYAGEHCNWPMSLADVVENAPA